MLSLDSNYNKSVCGWGSAPDPAEGTLAGFEGAVSQRRKRRERGGQKGRRKANTLK